MAFADNMDMTLPDGYRRGLLLTAAGTLIASFEGLLVRMLASLDSWSIVFFRGLLLGLVMAAMIVVLRQGSAFHVPRLTRSAAIAVIAYAANVTFFIAALGLTSVANTLVIASAAPLFAAAIGWVFLKERPSRETAAAVVAVFVGLAIIFWGSLGSGRATGDVLAFCYAVSLAAYFVALTRCAGGDVPWIVALGGVLSAVVAAPFAGSFIPADLIGNLWVLIVLGCIVVPGATLLLSWGPQLIPASHVTLIMLLEIGLAPLWVWLAFGEKPGGATVLGGALVLATIALHSWAMSRKEQTAAAG